MTLRDVKEVQRAHDLLAGIVLADVPNPLGDHPEATEVIICLLDVLCWVLKHDHVNTFPDNLKKIEDWLNAQGYQLEDHGN